MIGRRAVTTGAFVELLSALLFSVDGKFVD